MTIKDLEPKIVWDNFYGLTRVPRPSKHEEKVQQYLLDWGKARGIEVFRDDTGNIIFRKPATPGYENRRGVIFQGHMDMVPQKTADTVHDFLTDPIETEVIGEWLGAKGTTLGADNGIGVCLGLSVLEDNTLKHGPVEVLVTYDEETGMTGAECLKPGVLQGDILLNLDSETEGELYIGCAGGLDGTADFKYDAVAAPEGWQSWKLTVKGLAGGHSGMDIILYRANANRAAARIVLPLIEKYGVKIADFKGGSLRNAIPFEAEVTMLVNPDTLASLKADIDKAFGEIKAEFAETDPSAVCIFEALEVPVTEYIEDGVALRAVKSVLACPNGVERMSASVEGLTETSNNLARVSIANGKFTVLTLLRSSLDCAKEALARRIESAFVLAGCKVRFTGGYSGWAPDNNSIILKVMKETYRKIYGKDAKIVATHGGLECGILGSKYPHWDMVSFGPTIMYPHSPDEKLFIPSVERSWEYLKEVLKAVPEK